ICEQTESPAKGVKLVKREVVRVITPGTAVDPQLVEAKDSVYLASIYGDGDTFGAAFLETSSGRFSATEITGPDALERIRDEIEACAPREVLYPRSIERVVRQAFGAHSAPDSPTLFDGPSSKADPAAFTLTPID